MPITKSAKKSLRVSRTKQAVNKINTANLEIAIRKADAKSVNHAMSLIDKAAKTGLIHDNKAARLKSQLAKKLGTPKAQKPEVKKTEKTVAKKAEKTPEKPEKTVKKTESKAKKTAKK
jgi:small subunit ribosomal protein S20